MTSHNSKENNDDDNIIQQDILSGRKFSIAEAIGREGGSMIKGGSPIPKMDIAVAAIHNYIKENLNDTAGAIQLVLGQRVADSFEILSANIDNPKEALKIIIESILQNEAWLDDFVHQVDFRWGQITSEPPRFHKSGVTPHPDDEYTVNKIKSLLEKLLQLVKDAE